MTSPRTLADLPAWLVALLDLVVVLAFAATGRSAHDQGLTAGGVLSTAWPFAAGAVLGWVAVAAVHRRAPRSLADGVVVWLAALVAGMALRAVTGAGTAMPFVVVASLVLAAGLIGWRVLARLATRA